MWTIDRFEGIFAICETEDRKMKQIARRLLPPGCKEGDRIEAAPDGSYQIAKESGERRKNLEKRFHRLFEK